MTADYDAIIVGGGIQGAMMALECTRRGKRPLVIERGRFGEGASGNSFGIVHGGLRYLQSLDLRRWRRSREEQIWFGREFPAFVTPITCVMPLYRRTYRSRAAFRVALSIESWLGRYARLDSTGAAGVMPAESVPAFYGIPRQELSGAAYWPELAITDARALVRAILDRVERAGGAALEGHEAVHLNCRDGAVAGVFCRPQEKRSLVGHRAHVVFLCAGEASQALAARFDRPIRHLSERTLAFNLLLDAPSPDGMAIALSPVPGKGRSLFLRSDRGGLLVGTGYAPAVQGPNGEGVPDALVRSFLEEIVRAAPELACARVVDVLWGRLPDRDGDGRRLRDRDLHWDHGRHGGPRGLVTLVTTKLTTAHAHAVEVAERVWPNSLPLSAHAGSSPPVRAEPCIPGASQR